MDGSMLEGLGKMIGCLFWVIGGLVLACAAFAAAVVYLLCTR
jgi:hypothetical protein